eukprot:159225_1
MSAKQETVDEIQNLLHENNSIKTDKKFNTKDEKENSIQNSIELATYDNNNETEEEEKYLPSTDSNINIDMPVNTSGYIAPRVDDYSSCAGDASKCHAIQRIVHILEYYKKYNQQNQDNEDEEAIIDVYKYISNFKKYNVATFMEDWYQCKRKHFTTKEDFMWFKNNQ